jgi:hypothetical protein
LGISVQADNIGEPFEKAQFEAQSKHRRPRCLRSWKGKSLTWGPYNLCGEQMIICPSSIYFLNSGIKSAPESRKPSSVYGQRPRVAHRSVDHQFPAIPIEARDSKVAQLKDVLRARLTVPHLVRRKWIPLERALRMEPQGIQRTSFFIDNGITTVPSSNLPANVEAKTASTGSKIPRETLAPPSIKQEQCYRGKRRPRIEIDRTPLSTQKVVAMTTTLDLFDLAGFIGVLLIVVAYLLLQLDKLRRSSLSFSVLNAAGSLLIIVSLLFKFNMSAFLIEVFWFLISLLGLTKWFISRKRLQTRNDKSS